MKDRILVANIEDSFLNSNALLEFMILHGNDDDDDDKDEINQYVKNQIVTSLG